MTVLSHQSIVARVARLDEQRIVIEPYDPKAVGPHSIDVRLGPTLLVWTCGSNFEDFGDGVFQSLEATERGWHLEPGRFYLGATLEKIVVPHDLRCVLDGCSTEARKSLVIHQTGGSVDAGWRGHLTVEVTVTIPQWIKWGARIGQLTFELLDEPTDHPYLGRYLGDLFPQPPRIKP